MEIITLLANALAPPYRYWLLAIALLLFVAPRFIELQSSWLDFRLGRRNLDLERQRLELLKLRYEIEAIRKEHNLPDFGITTSSVPLTQEAPDSSVAPATPAQGEPTSIGVPLATHPIVRFLRAHPAVARPILSLLQIAFAIFAATFTIMVVVAPVSLTGGQDVSSSVWVILFAVIFYGFLTWSSLVASSRIRRLRREVDNAS